MPGFQNLEVEVAVKLAQLWFRGLNDKYSILSLLEKIKVMRTSEAIKTEIKAMFGFIPALFESVHETPVLFDHHWQQMAFAYATNPLPILFKEQLLAYLSRFVQNDYCIVCHSCALRPLGMSGPEIHTMLTTPLPTLSEIQAHLEVLQGQMEDLLYWPAPNTTLGATTFFSAALMYLSPRTAQILQVELRRVLKPFNYNHLASFLGFVKAYHQWAETHPDISYEQDERTLQHLSALLKEAPTLASFFQTYTEQVAAELRSQENSQLEQRLRQEFAAETEANLRQQAARTRQLHALTRASLAIDPALPLDTLLDVIVKQARRVVGAHLAYIEVSSDVASATPKLTRLSLSEKYEGQVEIEPMAQPELYTSVYYNSKPLRLTQIELAASLMGTTDQKPGQTTLRGLLVVPLSNRDDHIIGLVQLSDRYEGDFTAEDEAMLVQLAQLAATAIDNTRLYEETRRTVEAQKELDQLRDQFLSIASHELRTPLTSIKGFAQILQRNVYRTQQVEALDDIIEPLLHSSLALSLERQARILGSIVHQSNRLIGLIEEMLDISHIQSGQLRLKYNSQVSIIELVQRIVAQQQDVNINRQITFEPDQRIILGRIDEARIEQVVNNLISNALKYSAAESAITVGVGYELPPASLKRRGSRLVRVWVRDAGWGIAPEQQLHIFEQYYRVRNPDDLTTEGLGLGLYISQEIVTRHGGQLWVESAPGEGSTFSFTLPLD